MDGCHMERGTPSIVLDIRGSPCLNEEFHAQSSMVGERGVMECRLALVVLGADGYFTVEEDFNNHVLSVTACHVERSAAMTVDCIGLERERDVQIPEV